MKKSTLFCIVLAISLVISVFVVPSPKLNVREMQAIDEMDTGRMNRSHQIEPMKYLQYKASGWGVFALTAVLTAVLFPVASIFAKSDDDENRGKSLAQIEGKNPKQPKASDEEISGLSSEILSFFKTELEKRFKSVTIHKMFFEIGEYWNENEEECADFHLVIAPDGEGAPAVGPFVPSEGLQAAAAQQGIVGNSLLDIVRMANEEMLHHAQSSLTPEMEEASKQ